MSSTCHQELPKGKSLVKLMMKWNVFDKEVLGGTMEKYLKVECSHCSYTKENLLRNGWNNYAAHYVACVGKSNLGKLVSQEQKPTTSTLVIRTSRTDPQSDHKSHFVIATDKQKSTHMWLQMIVLKNMAIKGVECELTRTMVKYPHTKSLKTAKATGLYLCEIVEQKIKKMVDNSQCGQLIFDGWTQNGVHYVALFISFMTKNNRS